MMPCFIRYILSLRVLVIVLCIGSPGIVSAQRYPFYNLNVDDGLVQSQATCITQDGKGNLWIGTLGGVSRYDGRNFTNYKVRNGLPSNAAWSIAADAHDNIWIGTSSGISRYDGKSFANFSKPRQTIRNINNTQQLFAVNDTVWWRVQGEVFFIVRDKINKLTIPGDGTVSTMYVESGNLWLAKDGVFYNLRGGQWREARFTEAASQISPAVYRIAKGKSGFWVVTSTGIFRLEEGLVLPYMPNPAGMPQAISLTEDRAGALWLGTNSGVIRIDERTAQHFNKQNGLRDNIFLETFTDASGNVWMLSDGQGLFRFSGTQFTVLDESAGLPSAQISSIASAGPDSLFLGTYDAGLCLVSKGQISQLKFNTKPVPSVAALSYDNERSLLWVATRGKGLWMYDGKAFTQFDAATYGLPSNNINSLYNDDMGRLWVGFANGAAVLENDTFKVLPIKNITVVSFLSVGADSVLIATDKKNGLLLYHNGKVSDFATNTAADSSTIQCFVKEGNDLWLGSSDNGVVLYNMATHKATVINENSGLRSDFIYNIIQGSNDDIWVGTGFGIHRIRMNPEKDAQGNVKQEPEITFYGKAHGITGMESNINAVVKLPDESIWFGTTNGAVHYQPNTTVVSSEPSSIVLLSVKLTGESMIPESYFDSVDSWYGIPYHLRLPARKNNLSFTFQAIAPAGSEQVLYRYRMDGLETPWSDWSQSNMASYSELPPGKYVLRVQCRGADDENIRELKYAFEIITPFHKTFWFRMLVFATCVLIGIGLQYALHSARQRRERLLARLRTEEQDKIRVSTAEDFHDEIGNKLTRISVLSNVLKSKLPADPDTLRILGQIEDNTAQLYSGTRDILWSLKPSNDTLYEVLVRIRDFGMELFQYTDVMFSFNHIDEGWRAYRLPMNQSRNLIMIFKEALNNSLKYSKASHVWIEATMVNGMLELLLKDDGTGFDMNNIVRGNGLNNMEVRAGRLNGKLIIQSEKGKGTSITLTFKIPQKR